MTCIKRLLVIVPALLWGSQAWAGTNGYFVTYSSDIEEGEIELMLMNDITAPSEFRRSEGQGNYLSHMIELEYAPTQQFATEFMIEWFEDLETSAKKFTGFRWENRYRLFKDPVPLNPMIYVEYEDLDPETRFKMEVSGWVRPPYKDDEPEPDRERIMETRLVLSQNFGPFNVAANWINETDLENGHTAFGYAAGVMWMNHSSENHSASKGHEDHEGHETGKAGLGLEMYGGLGDTKAFAINRQRQEHYLGPIFMYHIDSHWMIHSQLAIGLSKASDNLVRFNVGYEF